MGHLAGIQAHVEDLDQSNASIGDRRPSNARLRMMPNVAASSGPLIRLVEWARRHRRTVASVVYAGVAAASLSMAYLARFEFDAAMLVGWHFGKALVLLVVIRGGACALTSYC